MPDDLTDPAAPRAPHAAPARFPHGSAPALGTEIEEAAQAIEDVGGFAARIARDTFGGFAVYVGELAVMLGQSVVALRRIHFGDMVRQMSVIGVDTIPITILTVGCSGAVLAMYIGNTLQQYGIPNLIGGVVGLSIFHETGPILVGIVAAARAGSAMTAEIGSMTVTEQIDALRSMAVSPIEYLVAPRLLASIIMLPILTLFADAAGIIGGGLISASMENVPYAGYIAGIRELTDTTDILRGAFKTIFFGLIVAMIGCREGMRTRGGAVGVGQSTTRSVVVSIVLIFFANFILSYLLFDMNII